MTGSVNKTHLGTLHVITAFILLYRWLAVWTRLWVGYQPQTVGRVLSLFLCSMH